MSDGENTDEMHIDVHIPEFCGRGVIAGVLLLPLQFDTKYHVSDLHGAPLCNPAPDIMGCISLQMFSFYMGSEWRKEILHKMQKDFLYFLHMMRYIIKKTINVLLDGQNAGYGKYA